MIDQNKLGLGLYRVWWKSGGSSLAAVGNGSDGTRWLAPTNWIEPTTSPDWDEVLKMEPISVDEGSVGHEHFWLDHIRHARNLLDTILDTEDGE